MYRPAAVLALTFCACLSSRALSACGGASGEAVRPKDFTAAGAVGDAPAKCTGTPAMAKPLVIDLPSEDRAALEAQMKKGIVFVSYDCVNVTVLPNCHVPDGNYQYAGVSRKEQVVQLKSQDDLSVNLPLSVGKFGADISSGRTLDLALVLVGLRSTTVDNMAKAGLNGTCDGATHFLQTAYVGAFSLATGSVGKVHAVADLFKVGGTSGSSESSRSNENTDGSLDACRTSDSDAPKPPPECSSPVRVQLQPVGAGVVAAAVAANANATANAADGGAGNETVASHTSKDDKPPPPPNPCRAGYVLVDTICTKPTAETAHQCSPEDTPDCNAQCDKGNGASCYSAAAHLDEAASLPFYKKACDGNYADGCWAEALNLYDTKAPPGPDNNAASVALAKKGCDLGGGSSCQILGDMFIGYWDTHAQRKDVTLALHSYERGCALGDDEACGDIGDVYLDGDGVAKDPAKAIELFDRACQGEQYGKCLKMGHLLASGDEGVTRDGDRAMRVARRSCAAANTFCTDASAIAFDAGHADEGFAIAKKACDDSNLSCLWLGDLYAQGKGTKKDMATAKKLWKKACDNGEGLSDACEKAHIKTKR